MPTSVSRQLFEFILPLDKKLVSVAIIIGVVKGVAQGVAQGVASYTLVNNRAENKLYLRII